MTIKEVEILTGITKANIRFYEKEGLLAPGRSSNNYREYSCLLYTSCTRKKPAGKNDGGGSLAGCVSGR